MSGADPATLEFEAALAELEARVRRIEAGEVGLEEALRLYEEGVALAERCQSQLEAAEARVARLTRGARGPETTSFPDADDSP